jgi:membrane glycosyltransferase
MSVARLQEMRHTMAAEPALGLVQSGIRLRPGQSRFAALERLSARLCGPPFLRGFASVAGDAGNYWGHNALIRVRAFAGAAGLPALPGRRPLGGPILSHDIVEAAWLVRAGWAVRVLPEARGSFEAGPETLAAFHRRDRRWCQGNLQHLRLIGAAGLHPLSRLHLICGVQNYLAAPIWLALVLLFASGLLTPSAGAGLALLAVAAVLLLPKLAALRHWQRRRRHAPRRARRVLRRAVLAELALSSLVAPLVMVRQTLAVAQVALGQDCGWRPGTTTRAARTGALEMAAGAGLVAVSLGTSGGGLAGLILLPVAGPLLAAPWLMRWLDRAPGRRAPAAPPLAMRPLPAG